MDVSLIYSPTVHHLVVVVGYGAGGLLVGVAIERVLLARLRKLALRSKWKADDIVLAGLGHSVPLWTTLAGLAIGIAGTQIAPGLSAGLHKALLAIGILSASLVGARILSGFLSVYARDALGADVSVSIIRNVIYIVVIAVGFLILLDQLGISITPILTALGVGGLAVALALQDTLSNLFAGFQILASKKVKPGDYVQLDSGQEGYVVDLTWRNTSIRALPNNIIIVPNAKLASALVTNYYRPEKEMAVLVQVGVSYDSDLREVERVTKEVAGQVMAEVTGGVPGFAPFIRYHTFADFSVNFTVILRAKEYTDQYLIKHEFVMRLHERYRQEGIEIPYPIRTLLLKPGDGQNREDTHLS